MQHNPGTYIVVLKNSSRSVIQIGRWGQLETAPGYYAYVGSAFGPGGIRARVSRHCREHKSKHWHIDYLREHTTPVSLWYYHSNTRYEHKWAQALALHKDAEAISGFGCSDCDCHSHLFYFFKPPNLDTFKRKVRLAVRSTDCSDLIPQSS